MAHSVNDVQGSDGAVRRRPRHPKAQQRRRRVRHQNPGRISIAFLNLHGGRRLVKWEELYIGMEEEGITLYGVAETHLRDLERPPVNPLWNWAGCNRESTARGGGGVGFLWREGSTWTPIDSCCAEHTWMVGHVHATPVLACVVYLSVAPNQHSENTNIVHCIRQDIERWGQGHEVLILGDFNGHIQELDGYTDHNGRLLLEMTQELSLEIANLRADCEGTYTWCARGLSSCIDYALVSPGLGKSLRNVHIDEEGRHSLGSDHNRLRLQFEASPWRQKVKKHEPATRFLPDAAYEEVANEFELCPGREQADTYEQYIAQLRQIMRKHEKIVKARRGFSRKSWWDGEVQAAIKARRTANRCHRQCVKRPHSEDVQATWQEYLRRKREMQAITQRKIAEANHKTLHAIKSAGRGAAAKFWTYVSRLDGKATQPEIRTESTGDKTTDLHRALTDHLHQLYAQPHPSTHTELPCPDVSEPTGTGHQKWTVARSAIDRAISKIGARTARGFDGIPAGLVKRLGAGARAQLADFFSEILAGGPIPSDWLRGKVILLPKRGGDPGLLRDYRPLTITSVVYRVFAQVLKVWMTTWAEEGGHLTELQNGFRRDRRLEDNLFVLTQCIEVARKEERGLIGCFLDVSKAYDSVPHELLLQHLEALGMPPTWTGLLGRLYRDSSVVATLNGAYSSEVRVGKGLKQGCPLSPLLYMLYTAGVERKILASGVGFVVERISDGLKEQQTLPGLVFADDIVLLAGNSGDLQTLVTSCAEAMAPLGLQFNTKKSAVVNFSGPGLPGLLTLPDGGLLPEAPEYRYLGVNFWAQVDYTANHERHLRQTSQRAGQVLRRRCLWGFNRPIMVRELWKAVHVPALTFANAVICPAAQTREWLERSQRAVGRLALGCHGNVANEAVQGDLGWSCFEAREARSKLSYEGRLRLMQPHRWARRIFDYVHRNGIRTRWSKRLQHLSRKYGFYASPVQEDTERKWSKAVKTQVRMTEADTWRRDMEEKSTLRIYRESKQEIHVEPLFDNSVASSLLFEARAGALRTLAYRRRFDDSVGDAMCRVCGADEETIEHLVMNCEGLTTAPTDGTTLQQALGFSPNDAPDGGGVATTKKRLSEWWTKVRAH